MTAGDRLRLLVVTAGGVGLVPRAPGTAGSAATVIALALLERAGVPGHLACWAGAALASLTLLVLGRWLRGHFGAHDPGCVVLDEVAGQCLALATPLRTVAPVTTYVLGFVLFRIFDVLKPLGVRHLERLPGAWGILLDDLLAGIYTWLLLTALWWLYWRR